MSSGDSPKPKILIADDEPSIRELLEQVLIADGFEVVLATDGKDALQQILACNPDVILLDIRMPKLDGVTLCKALRVYKETAHTPIIMLTAYNTREHLEQSMAAGADDFLAKPFEVTELRIRVRAMLKLKHVSNELERLQQYIQSIQQLREKTDVPLPDRS
jgi:two-component system cell cycle response regulator